MRRAARGAGLGARGRRERVGVARDERADHGGLGVGVVGVERARRRAQRRARVGAAVLGGDLRAQRVLAPAEAPEDLVEALGRRVRGVVHEVEALEPRAQRQLARLDAPRPLVVGRAVAQPSRDAHDDERIAAAVRAAVRAAARAAARAVARAVRAAAAAAAPPAPPPAPPRAPPAARARRSPAARSTATNSNSRTPAVRRVILYLRANERNAAQRARARGPDQRAKPG